jgi:hypothetical protein
MMAGEIDPKASSYGFNRLLFSTCLLLVILCASVSPSKKSAAAAKSTCHGIVVELIELLNHRAILKMAGLAAAGLSAPVPLHAGNA